MIEYPAAAMTSRVFALTVISAPNILNNSAPSILNNSAARMLNISSVSAALL